MLQFFTLKHVSVGIVGDREDVRWHLSLSLSAVHVNHLRGVDGQHPVGVHGHTEQARVGLQNCYSCMQVGIFEYVYFYTIIIVLC